MPSNKNTLVLGCAGSRKTTLLTEKALKTWPGKVLITTFTNENVDQIRAYLIANCNGVPPGIDVLPWDSFLLRHGVRPYQNMLSQIRRVRTIHTAAPSAGQRFVRRDDIDKYYFTSGNDIYVDKVAEFVCQCDDHTGGLVVERLKRIYSHIFIDEFQDFAGYDFDFVEKLFRSSVAVTIACDPRQGTFSTNRALRNKQFKKTGIKAWLDKVGDLVRVEERNECFRSNQIICDFADELYPDFPKTVSKNAVVTGHDGIFQIKENEIDSYARKYSPKVLRYSTITSTMGLPATNIGMSKGRTYDRVLVFPTEKMAKYLETKDLADVGDKAKLYVAVTRAKYSVAFVTKKKPARRVGRGDTP